MGATLNITSAKNGYTLSDRATWLAFKNKGELEIVYENNAMLNNQYGIIAVNPRIHKNVQYKNATIFIKWITSPRGQNLIKSFTIKNQQAFFPNAR
jgi:tungstate transport system substrate-binding protein